MGDDVDNPVTKGSSSFMTLSIRFQEVVGLLRFPCANPGQQRMYIQTTLEPGNVAAATPVFTDPAQFPLETALNLPPSLCFERASSSEILVELWGIRDKQHELVGFCSTAIESLVTANTRLTLARRKGRAPLASLTVSATASPCSRLSALESICADGGMSIGAAKNAVQSALVLNFIVLAAIGLEVSALSRTRSYRSALED